MPPGVYKRKTIEERFWLYVRKDCDNGCWEWTGGCSPGGYGITSEKRKSISTHRFSYAIHHPLTQPIRDIKLFVLHSCDNPKCVNPQHLRLGTPQENMNDRTERGRCNALKGEHHGLAKLTDTQVLEIREKYAQGNIRHIDLGEEYGVSAGHITDIINNRKRRTKS